MGTKYSSTLPTGYNSNPPADDGSQVASNKVKYSTIKSKLADPLNTYASALDTALQAAFDTSSSITSVDYTTVASDNLKPIEVSGTTTISLGDAATMKSGYQPTIVNVGTGIVTVALATDTDTLNGVTGGSIKLGPTASIKLTVNNSADGYNAISSVVPNTVYGFRNLIINGNFAINQRAYASGTATTAANQYTLDRWYIEGSGDSVTFAASGNGNEITIGSGVNFSQKIENVNILGGKYTLSWTGTATATVGGTAVTNGDSVTLTANTQTTVTFTDGTVSQVQLEPGEVATAFEQRPKAIEEILCYRYAFVTNYFALIGFATSTTDCTVHVTFPVEMRSKPTVTLPPISASTFDFNVGNTWVTAASPVASVIQLTGNNFSMAISGFSGLTQGDLAIGNSATGGLLFISEL